MVSSLVGEGGGVGHSGGEAWSSGHLAAAGGF